MQDIFLGRQPIFDRDLKVYAYELLFRSGDINAAGKIDGDQATSKVISNAMLEFGLEEIVGNRPAFINLTRGFLTGSVDIPLPRDLLVLEILEDIEPDDIIINALAQLHREGYTLALDDFIFREELRPLLPFASIVKVDILPMSETEIAEHAALLKEYPVKLLAEKVETQAEYDFCRELGFDYFQGYFLSRPEIVKGKEIAPNGLATVRLLARLQDPEIGAAELETLIGQDVGLSYKLLRYINSAFFALPKKVESIRQAVVYLGNQAIKTWATLLVFCGVEDKPNELMKTAMLRAKMCELLADAAHKPQRETYFTVGLFSCVEAILDMPLTAILNSLPFTEDVRRALLEQEGPYGAALKCALAFEHADWGAAKYEDLATSQITGAYVDAVKWADDIASTLN